MKVHFIFQFKQGPAGGGNNFLKNLKQQFIADNLYADDPAQADYFLFNSHHFIDDVIKYKKLYPEKTFIHRIDGPMKLYNNNKDTRDDSVNLANKYFADATIFQSLYSKESNTCTKAVDKTCVTIIPNAANAAVFGFENIKINPQQKIKLISSSWSTNVKKGFDTYKYLDETLDFNKFEYHFIGNSPYEFKNIKSFPAQDAKELATSLQNSHIYITASLNDSCSNSLIEAASTGLPVLAIDSGGNPELIHHKGLTFNHNNEIKEKLDLIIKDYPAYAEKYPISFDLVYNQYKEFIFNCNKSIKSQSCIFFKYKHELYLKKIFAKML